MPSAARRLWAIALVATAQACNCGTPKTPPCAGKNLQTDPANCGVCGNACAATFTCAAGACHDPCAGKDLQTDAQNCGACGHACATGQSCGAGTCLDALAVAFTQPAEGSAVLPRFVAGLALTYTGAVDLLTLAVNGGTPIALTPAPSVSPIVDASAVADGALSLVATLKQGTRTVTATRTLTVSRLLLQPHLAPLAGFFKGAESVTVSATFPSAQPTQVSVLLPGGATLGMLQAPAASGAAWSGTFAATDIGPGDSVLQVSAADALGNQSAAASGTITIAQLHGVTQLGCTSNCITPSILGVKSPEPDGGVQEAVLYLANLDVSGTRGELRYTAFGGGQTTVLAPNACVRNSNEIDGLVSADASRVIFTAQDASGHCTQLYQSALPPSGAPQLLSASFAGTGVIDFASFSTAALISLDGSVIAWADGAFGGSSFTVHWATPGGTPQALAAAGTATTPTLTGYRLKDALVISTPGAGGSLGSSFLLNAAGAAALNVVDGGTSTPLSITYPDYVYARQNAEGTWTLSADGTTVLAQVQNPLQYVSIRDDGTVRLLCDVKSSGFCANGIPLQGDKLSWLNAGAVDSAVEFYEAADGGGAEIPDASNSVSVVNGGNVILRSTSPLDGTWTGLQLGTADAGAVALEADGGVVPIAPASGLDGTQLRIYAMDWSAVNTSGPSMALRTPFFDETHAVVTDPGHEYATVLGSAPVRLDSDAAPLASALYLTRDRARLVYATAATGGVPALSTFAFGAAAPVSLQPAGTGTGLALPTGTPEGFGPTSDELSDKWFAFAMNLSATALRLYVARLDGSAGGMQITRADDADAVDQSASRYGVTTDDTVWWVAIDGHLYAQAIGASSKVDFGAIYAPSAVTPLAGGVFVFQTGNASATQVNWATLTNPTPVLVAQNNLGGLAVDDDRKTVWFTDGTTGVYSVSAQGPRTLVTGSGYLSIDVLRSGLIFASGSSGALWAGRLYRGAGPPALVEHSGVTSLQNISAQFVPTRAGMLLGTGAGGNSGPLSGAQPRSTFVYTLSGTARDGVYLWDVVDTLFDQPGS